LLHGAAGSLEVEDLQVFQRLGRQTGAVGSGEFVLGGWDVHQPPAKPVPTLDQEIGVEGRVPHAINRSLKCLRVDVTTERPVGDGAFGAMQKVVEGDQPRASKVVVGGDPD